LAATARAGNNGSMFHHAEAARSTRRQRHAGYRAACVPSLRRSRAPGFICRRRRTCAWGGRADAPRSSNSRFRTPISMRLNEWAPKVLAKMQTLPELRDVATDQQSQGTTLQLKINRDTPLRVTVSNRKLIDDTLLRCLRAAAGPRSIFTQLNSYPRDPGDPPGTARQLSTRSTSSTSKSPLTRRSGAAFRHSQAGPSVPVRPLSDQPIRASSRPSPSASTSPRTPALGQATDAVQRGDGGSRCAFDGQLELPGHRAGVPAVARKPYRC